MPSLLRRCALLSLLILGLPGASLGAQTWSGGPSKPSAPPRVPRSPRRKPAPKGPQVDLNRASKAQLKKVPGFTGPIVDRIIAARPFHSKADIVIRGIVSEAVFLGIRDRIKATYVPDPRP